MLTSESFVQAAKLFLPVGPDNSYRQALSIPITDFQHFSLAALPWLRYSASTIYGPEGHISSAPHGPVIAANEAIRPQKYYYVSQDSALLLDPDLMVDRTSIATAESAGRGGFRQRVVDRDETCVLTGNEENLIACHVVPHAKTRQVGEDVDPPLDDINDTRNGILLYTGFHHAFGESRVAFLRTPNFAMAIADVDRVAQPGRQLQPLGTNRVTFQHFNINDRNLAMLAPHNCDATIADSDEWPADLIFDIAYGCAVVEKWGTPSFMQLARKNTYDIYYDEGGNSDDADGGNRDDGNPHNHTQERAQRAGRRAGKSVGQETAIAAREIPDIHDMILGLWQRSAKKDRRTSNAAKVDRTKKEVQAWLGSVV